MNGLSRGLVLLAFVPAAWGQEPPPFPPDVAPTTAPALAERFREARTYLITKDWDKVVGVLQGVLELPEDAFIPLRTPDKAVVWGSARRESLRLLSQLPAAGREFYESAQGPRIAALVAQAKNTHQPELLAEAVRLGLYTKAGAEAARLLGVHHLDRGRPDAAARCFTLLLDDGRTSNWEPASLYQAALAFHRSGNRADFDRAWKLLATRDPAGVTLGQRKLSLGELRKQFGPVESLPDGADERIASLKPLWHVPLSQERDGQVWIGQALRQMETENRPALPALIPLVRSERVMFRTHRGPASVNLADSKLLWESVSDVSLESLPAEPAAFTQVSTWVQNMLRSNPQLLLSNSILGMLSAGQGHVYAIEDIPLPVWPDNYMGFRAKGGTSPQLPFAPKFSETVLHSRLLAVDGVTGKITWEIGGHGDGPLDDTFFLGPPLILGSRLYLLAEKSQELKLLCLDSSDGKLLWSQRLALPKNRLLLDGGRRLHAAPLVHAGGILICPTNTGAVLGFDLTTRSLLWTNFYQKPLPAAPAPPAMIRGRPFPNVGLPSNGPPHLKPSWQVAAPLIAGDRVVIAPPDEDALVCAALRDGATMWRVEKEKAICSWSRMPSWC